MVNKHKFSNNLLLNKQNKNTLTIFDQNICGLLNKKEALLNFLTRNSPQIICITEHPLIDDVLENITLHPYTLQAKFCRQTHKCRGVGIFIQDNMHCTTVNMDKYSIENDIEICAVKLHILPSTKIIITVYRSPTGSIANFLNNFEAALNQIYNNTVDVILCRYFNINYLNDNQSKQLLNSLLASYSLYSIIDFPTKIHNNLHIRVDNIFINKLKNESFSVYSLANGLSSHDAQVLSLSNITVPDDSN